MLKLEINDKRYNIPEGFNELTLEQYCKAFYKLPHPTDEMDDAEKYRLIKENEANVLSRIMGEEDGFCLDLPLNVYSQLSKAIDFIYDSDYFMKNAKPSIVIDNKRYSIPPMNEMSMRQFIDADVVINDENEDQYIELLSILLLTKDKEGKWIPYNGDYKPMYEKVSNLTCDKALGLVYHFFKKGEALQKLSEASMKVEEASRQLQSTPSS